MTSEPRALAPAAPSPGGLALRLAGLAAVWLAMAKYLGTLGIYALPRSLLGHFTLESYGMVVQIVMTLTGVGLAFVLVRRPRVPLGLEPPKPAHLAVTLLVVPAILVATTWTALQIALPYLLHDLQTQGANASRENAGAFGKAVTEAPLFVALVWGALLAAVSEELIFRGAVWSAVRAAVMAVAVALARPTVGDDGELRTEVRPDRGRLVGGIVATLAAAALFGWMHADMKGGVGVVRVVATTCLGLACGATRLVTGSLFATMLLHLAYNTLSIGVGRKWFASASEPLLTGIPNPLLVTAVVTFVVAMVVGVAVPLARRPRASRVSLAP